MILHHHIKIGSFELEKDKVSFVPSDPPPSTPQGKITLLLIMLRWGHNHIDDFRLPICN